MYLANENRYDHMTYRRAGNSGLLLPPVSLGLWRGHGDQGVLANTRDLVLHAFDEGIIHFDLANNYGPSRGSAETNFGAILKSDLMPYRDELIISSKAGYYMHPGPYGEFSSKKYLYASLDTSLKRMGLDYVDIFYSHRPDPNTPFEETAETLDLLVRQGKALYIGISNYFTEDTKKMIALFEEKGTPFVIHQMSYNMLNREVEEDGLFDLLEEHQLGAIAYGPLAEGLLSDKFSQKIPDDFPIHRTNAYILQGDSQAKTQKRLHDLYDLAQQRGQTLSQMALAWLLRKETMTSVVVGTTTIPHFDDNLAALKNTTFSDEELTQIEKILH